jgi:hypothetical protein
MMTLFFWGVFSVPRREIRQDWMVSLLLSVLIFMILLGLFQQVSYPFIAEKINRKNPLVIWLFDGVNFYHSGVRYWVRPSGMTGSYLHFPLIIVTLSIIIIRLHAKKWQLIIPLFSFLMPFITMSRSGVLLVVSFWGSLLILYSTSSHGKMDLQKSFKKKSTWVALLFAFIFLILLSFLSATLFEEYLVTVFSRLFNFWDQSNIGRFQAWSIAWNALLEHNFLFGGMTGAFTNSVGNILGYNRIQSALSVGVPESSLLGIMTSYGIIGTLLIYGAAFLGIYRLIRYNKDHVVAAGLIAVIVQSLFYQSYEVLPFMFCVSLLIFFRKRIINPS